MAEGGQQGARSPEGEPTLEEALFGGRAHVRLGERQVAVSVGEVFVLDALDDVGAYRHVTSPGQSEGLDAGRAVERFGDRCAPVDDQGIEVAVRHRETSDVEGVDVTGFVGLVVEAAKEKGLVADGQLIEATEGGGHDDVTFDEVTDPAHGGDGDGVAQASRLVTHVLEGLEGDGQKGLLLGYLALVGHGFSFRSEKCRVASLDRAVTDPVGPTPEGA